MKNDINQNIILFIISLIGFLYYKYNSPNQIIDRYYKKQSETEYYILKYTVLLLKLIMIINLRYIVVFIFKKFIK
jgi:hypothetical protein